MLWIVLLVLALLAGGVIVLFWRSESRRGRRLFDIARGRELNGEFEEACFYYAAASMAGYQQETCYRKTVELWGSHGPFEFSQVLEQAKQESCRHQSCGEGFCAITVDHVRKIVKDAT